MKQLPNPGWKQQADGQWYIERGPIKVVLGGARAVVYKNEYEISSEVLWDFDDFYQSLGKYECVIGYRWSIEKYCDGGYFVADQHGEVEHDFETREQAEEWIMNQPEVPDL